MPTGCTHVTAQNYDSAATEWDHSCIYIFNVVPANDPEHNTVCLLFKDVAADSMENVSFTMSYSIEGKDWVFFHDYIPDFYFSSREKLYSLNSNNFFRHNTGAPGVFYEQETTKSFFIDVIFKDNEELILETVNWISSVFTDSPDNHIKGSEWDTLTHITIWNSQQHTGRIALQEVFAYLQYETSRNVNGQWSFNDFRNALLTRGVPFLQSLFNDFAVIPGSTGTKDWYDAELMQDKYFVVRFEFDNSNGKLVTLHQTAVQAIKAKR